MARIRIEDLTRDEVANEQQMLAVQGGALNAYRGLQVTPITPGELNFLGTPGGAFSSKLAVMVEKQG